MYYFCSFGKSRKILHCDAWWMWVITLPTVSLHLCSKRYQQSVLNIQAFIELRVKNMYETLVEASLANQVGKSNQNCFMMEPLFRIRHFMIIKNWGYTHNFQDVVKLAGNDMKTHLMSTPKNAIYTSP